MTIRPIISPPSTSTMTDGSGYVTQAWLEFFEVLAENLGYAFEIQDEDGAWKPVRLRSVKACGIQYREPRLAWED